MAPKEKRTRKKYTDQQKAAITRYNALHGTDYKHRYNSQDVVWFNEHVFGEDEQATPPASPKLRKSQYDYEKYYSSSKGSKGKTASSNSNMAPKKKPHVIEDSDDESGDLIIRVPIDELAGSLGNKLATKRDITKLERKLDGIETLLKEVLVSFVLSLVVLSCLFYAYLSYFCVIQAKQDKPKSKDTFFTPSSLAALTPKLTANPAAAAAAAAQKTPKLPSSGKGGGKPSANPAAAAAQQKPASKSKATGTTEVSCHLITLSPYHCHNYLSSYHMNNNPTHDIVKVATV